MFEVLGVFAVICIAWVIFVKVGVKKGWLPVTDGNKDSELQ